MARRRTRPLSDDPLWYKDAVIYELHVRAFRDSDGDGVGDFAGLTSKLDYLQQLGVTAIWLLPFYPSPLRDDGYDIADYSRIHAGYGSIRDFDRFLQEAHARGMRVITELVINHTSDQHAWFQRARRAKPDSRERDFYVWSETPDRYADARIIFKDFEHSNWTWDPLAKAYYWHRFYSHQPDLNFDNPVVRRELLRVLDFWLGLGVDGLRLDAVPYLYERDGTDCENLPETHAYLRELRKHVDEHFPNRMLLAEANQWPEDAAAYFGGGDECHMSFHFPLMPRLFMSLQLEDRLPILDILRQTPAIHPTAQWALFLRNHDELTLEMVTDEERDYMYRVYALDQRARINLGIRRRLAPLLGNNRRAIELLNALLFSLPGTPVLYYGDEIGMGDNIYLGDRNGVRTPMQWSADRNAGFSEANPQSLYLPVIGDTEYDYETINVEAQSNNPNSLLWWMRGTIALRKRHRAFGRGDIEFLEPQNRKVLAFVRSFEEDVILVVANLSRFAQYVELDLSARAGSRPVELFGRSEFPRIGEEPWLLTLGAHSFYWFHLEPARAPAPKLLAGPPQLVTEGRWETVAVGGGREELEELLPGWLVQQRWYGGKARELSAVELRDVVPLGNGTARGLLALAQASYSMGGPETYLLPLAFASGEAQERLMAERPEAVIARLRVVRGGEASEGLLLDGVHDPGVRRALIELVRRRRTAHGAVGSVVGRTQRGTAELWRGGDEQGTGRVMGGEQSNTSIAFGDKLILKLFRRLEEGTNADLEMGLFLTGSGRFPHTPAVAGWIDYEVGRGRTQSLASVHSFVANDGDAWSYTLDEAERFLEQAAARLGEPPQLPGHGVLSTSMAVPSPAVHDAIGPYLESARLLGQRTAEMHVALSSDLESPDFRPERFTPFARRALYQSVRNQVKRGFLTLRGGIERLEPEQRRLARQLLELEDALLERLRQKLARNLASQRTRIHGDFHLGQVLRTGSDFVIIDFEGEPALALGERRLKRSPLRDVAGMLRSFHYASAIALRERLARRMDVSDDERDPLQLWARAWSVWVAGEFLAGYLALARSAPFLAEADDAEIETLLNVHSLEKTVYELTYEMNNRPQWVPIPLGGIRQVWSELAA